MNVSSLPNCSLLCTNVFGKLQLRTLILRKKSCWRELISGKGGFFVKHWLWKTEQQMWWDIYKMVVNETDCCQRNGKWLLLSKCFISSKLDFTLEMSCSSYLEPMVADNFFPSKSNQICGSVCPEAIQSLNSVKHSQMLEHLPSK